MPDTDKVKASRSKNLIKDLYFGTAEKTVARSSYHPQSLEVPYNPDDLYRRAGDYSIYEDMTNDDQVEVCMQLKKDMILAAGFEFETQEDGQEDIVADLEKAFFEDFECPFEDRLEEIIQAYEFGFSLTEKIFKLRPDSTLCLKDLKTRHPATWLIETDEGGNVERYLQRSTTGDIEINPDSLIHYINRPKWQNAYGNSDLRKCFDAWFVKRQVVRYYAMFLEKASTPIPHAKYDRGKVDDELVDKIYSVLKRFQSSTSLVYPKDFEIGFLEAKSNGDAFKYAINLFNMFIGRALFVPDLLGFQGSESQQGGSQALGREHMELFIKHIQRRRRTLERLVNRHLVYPIVVYNHGFVDHYPKFKLKPISEEDTASYAELFLKAVNGKAYVPTDEEINHFRSLIQFPESDEVERYEPPQPINQVPQPINQVDDDEIEVPEKNEPDADEFAIYKKPAMDYAHKVDFNKLKNNLDSTLKRFMQETRGVVDEIVRDLLTQVKRKKIIEKRALEKVDMLKLKKLNRLQQSLKQNFKEHFSKHQQIAQEEMFGKQNFATPLPSAEFLQILEQETFQYVGDWEYNVTKGARQTIIQAIKDGTPLNQVVEIIEDETKRAAEVSLERYARTKFTEVMNRGRLEYFDGLGIVEAYQYSAILDDRTTTICRGLHGKIFAAGTEPIPPMHFNCRSLLIPITRFEDFKVTTKIGRTNINDYIEKHKGKGFPKR